MAKRKMGPFELDAPLGTGGMGTVYRATYTQTGQSVAVKVLAPGLSTDDQLVSRFEREMKILKKLRHPNIVRYYGGGKVGVQRFYAMELIEAGSVDALLKRRGRLSWEQTIQIGKQVCRALQHAHEHGIIHRDLKPANLFLTRDGKVKLGDFGIARDTDATALTMAGKTVGTYAYMAPEQIRGEPPISPRTDLYALGCVLFQLLTGRPPFLADTPAEMLFKHLDEPPPHVSEFTTDCPIWLDRLIDELLAKDPQDRPYDALATEVALDEVATKVAEQASLVAQTAAAGATVQGNREKTRVAGLSGGKKKRRKRKSAQTPFYERAWFLTACLLLLIVGVVWAMQPPSEEKLIEGARALMQSEDTSQWLEARREYLEPLLERYPDGEFADEAREYLERIELHLLDKRVETALRLGRDPKSEAERLYREARELERFGDRVAALEQYRALADLLKASDDPEERRFMALCHQRANALEEAGAGDDDRVAFVNEQLDRAERLYREGKTLAARGIWNRIVDLYADNREFEPQVRRAQAHLEETSARDLTGH